MAFYLQQPTASISASQVLRPMSSATMPNGSFSRVQKPAGTFSSDGGLELINSRQQSVATLLSLDKKPVIAPSSAPIGILLAAPIGESTNVVFSGCLFNWFKNVTKRVYSSWFSCINHYSSPSTCFFSNIPLLLNQPLCYFH